MSERNEAKAILWMRTRVKGKDKKEHTKRKGKEGKDKKEKVPYLCSIDSITVDLEPGSDPQ